MPFATLMVQLIARVATLAALGAAAVAGLYLSESYPPSSLMGHTATSTPVLSYHFNDSYTLEESATLAESTNPYFWLNSGGNFIVQNGVGKTVEGALGADNPWRQRYASSNGRDTENGYRPQNLFRLISRSRWEDPEQTLRFNITHTNLTPTPNRGAWSGVFLFSRYQDSNNLYYAGLRFDGSAVIKKKYQGNYYTLAATPVFSSPTYYYDEDTNPNLIPTNAWHNMKMVTYNRRNDEVVIELWLFGTESRTWRPLLSVTDTVALTGTPPINGSAYVGIRTDYSDVRFSDYEVRVRTTTL